MIPLADDTPRQHAPIVMWVIAALNLAVFALELNLPEEQLARVFGDFGILPARDSQVLASPSAERLWPYFTSMFLHGGWLHLLGNLWMLWIFGDNVEDRMGPWRFTLFYLLSGLAAGAVHVASDPASEAPTIGASGAIAGVLGAYALLYPKGRVLVLFPVLFYPLLVRVPALLFAGVWFLLQFVQGTRALDAASESAGIAWWAHIGGLVAGAGLCLLFLHPQRRRRQRYLDEHAGYDRMWSRLV